ncbi:matrixin family metalloprotease [Roseateles sp. BYS87W]|uniref:Matrixin family metalloprotease n=1 Tax=Pelomonas baiyunensis TaxID=3299026 RepID=A0ABW7GWA0_9BURK
MNPVRFALSTLGLAAALAATPASALNIVFDYTLDKSNFFTQDKRNVLEQVASIFEYNLTNTLQARTVNTTLGAFMDSNGAAVGSALTLSNYQVAADTIVFFMQAGAFTGSTLGVAYVGTARSGYADMIFQTQPQSLSSLPYPALGVTTNPYANQTRALFSYDQDIRNFERPAPESLPVNPNQPNGARWVDVAPPVDFASVVMHEMGHAFGLSHSSNLPDAMYPSIGPVQRKFFDANDWNAMTAAGWSIRTSAPDLNLAVVLPQPVPEPATWALMALGVLALQWRRRTAG